MTGGRVDNKIWVLVFAYSNNGATAQKKEDEAGGPKEPPVGNTVEGWAPAGAGAGAGQDGGATAVDLPAARLAAAGTGAAAVVAAGVRNVLTSVSLRHWWDSQHFRNATSRHRWSATRCLGEKEAVKSAIGHVLARVKGQ